MDSRIQGLIDSVKETTAPSKGLVVPVSGGSDSALAFWLCSQAQPGKTVGLYFGDKLRSAEWFAGVGEIRTLPEPADGTNKEVERWAKSLTLSLAETRWLVGTRNRTESALGTFSLASRLATYLPLGRLWKSEVMELCKLVGVPDAVTASSRRADPDCGRPQELSEIPLETIDLFLKVRAGELPESSLAALAGNQTQYLEGLYAANRFKLLLPTLGPSLPR